MEVKLKPQERTFAVWEIIRQAWELVGGSKWPIWAIALFIVGIVSLIIQLIIAYIFRIDIKAPPMIYQYLILPCINSIVIAPFFGGAVMVGITRARGKAISPKSGYQYFRKTLALMITMLIMALLANIINTFVHLHTVVATLGLGAGWLNILAAIISLLVYVFLFLSVPLVTDKNLAPLKALKLSFKVVKHCWFKVLILFITVYLFFLIAMIPLFVGTLIHPYARLLGIGILIAALIWLIPFVFLVEGVLYHKLVD